ncbi:MAG TPA: PQQ-dependent sugar dehydrogenase [Armatimonadota bacterium]|nr:PQQ-dependent sugar dehydrogenase [Armatimonadota bacterium]
MKRSQFISSTALIMAITVLSGCRNKSTVADGASSKTQPTPVEETVVGGLQEPVSLVFLSNDIMLVAERRAGRIRWVEHGKLRDEPFATVPVPTVSGYNEHGLLGLAVDPDYPSSPYVYAFHTVPNQSGRPSGQEVVRFTVKDGKGVDERVIVGNLPASTGCCHDGGRILFGADDRLYVSLGDTMHQELAQDYDALPGKILRYNDDGSVPDDNPYELQKVIDSSVDSDTPAPSQRTPVYTLGHRNVFGMAVNPATGGIYVTENGPDRDDEINYLAAGDNYGWPEVVGLSSDARFHQPLWVSGKTTIAPTGAVVYSGTIFSQYRGDLLFAAYKDGNLRRVVFDGPEKVSRVDVIGAARDHARLDVAMSPDGLIYYSSMDTVYRLVPAKR